MYRRTLIALLSLVALTRCDRAGAEGENPTDVNGVMLRANSTQAPQLFPPFVLYPGARIVMTGENDTGTSLPGAREAAALLSSPDTTAKITEYYERLFKQNGWNIIQSFQNPEGTLIMAESPYRQIVTAIMRKKDPTLIRLYFKETDRN